MLVKSGDLTRGEKLRLTRRRQGATQSQAAKKYETTIPIYRIWENGEEKKAPNLAIGILAKHEQCWLLRYRKKQTLGEVAGQLQVSPYWLSQMEKGKAPIQRLWDHWRRSA